MTMNRRTLLATGAASAALPMFGGVARAQTLPKIGFVYLTSPGDHGWTFAHEQGRLQLVEEMGDQIETVVVENVEEGPDSERVIRRMAEEGADMIFTTSFGYMNPTERVAQRFPNVKFEHATGYKRAENLATYNARFYEGRAICGAIAGHLSESGVAGYVASYPIPEVVMGINAFTLAAQKVNPNFQTKVIWVSSWYDPSKEADAASTLIDQGADIITQHTDSPAALQICEQRGLMAFGQSWDMRPFAPTAHLTAIEDHWGGYYVSRVKALLDGSWATGDTWWGMKEGMVQLTEFNDRIPADVKALASQMEADIIAGALDPFTGPITDREGTLRLAEGETAADEMLHSMDWYVTGVQG